MQSLHTEGPERAEEHPPLVFLLAWTKNEVFFHEQKRKFQEDKDSSPASDQFDPEAPAPGVAGDGCCQSTALVRQSAQSDFSFNDCSELIVSDSDGEFTQHANMQACDLGSWDSWACDMWAIDPMG